jgi:hypothetical protein
VKNVLQWLFTICVVCTFRCSPSTGPVGPDVLSNLRFAPSAFDSFKRNTELKFSLKVPETLNISIVRRNASGADFRVKILIGNARETRGSHSVSWLGDTDDGLFAPAGIYFALVEIGSQSYETSVQVFHF